MWFRGNSKPADVPVVKDVVSRSPFAGWPKTIFFAVMLVFASYASTHMVAAGDTWVALACGRHFYNHGVNTVEPFSANSHPAGPTVGTMEDYAKDLRGSLSEMESRGQGATLKAGVLRWWTGRIESYPQWPQWKKDMLAKWHPTGWINQNWLTHLLFYWLSYKSPIADAASRTFNSLVYWKFAMYIIAVFVVYYAARVGKADVAIAASMACLAMFVGRSFLDIRPAGFSNVLSAVFLLILMLATYRRILYIWLIVPLVVLWCNLHGGYVFVFLMMSAFIAMHLVLALLTKYRSLLHVWLLAPVAGTILLYAIQGSALVFAVLVPCLVLDILVSISNRWYVSIGMRGIWHCIGASATAFVGMVVFNPFHLTNLTHTYVISFSQYAEKWREVNEWHSAFEWTNPVGTGVPYLIMLILLLMILALWVVLLLLDPEAGQSRRRDKKPDVDTYQWPKVDLAVMLVMAMTVMMAIKSRRFIPIGAAIACPVMAMMLDQSIRMLVARANLATQRKAVLSLVPSEVRWGVICAAVLAFIGFGGWWGWEFKKIYLDPWPAETKYTSIFMRMTASNVKPFEACDFIRENKLSGNMFNYWTEGGFIAWGQDPDPVTGKTPLQLFMDGRAQAAYDVKTYDEWGRILAGGDPAMTMYAAERAPTMADLDAIGNWVDKKLTSYNVWVVLMPSVEFNDPQKVFTDALERNDNWRPVYYDGSQKMLARFTDPRGSRLFADVLTEKAKFPDQRSADLTVANWLLRVDDPAAVRLGLDRAKRAFEASPSQETLIMSLFAYRRAEFKDELDKMCRDWLTRFVNEQEQYRRADGYRIRLTAALAAADHVVRFTSDQRERATCQALRNKWIAEFNQLAEWSRW
jgi:hypothetical protein